MCSIAKSALPALTALQAKSYFNWSLRFLASKSFPFSSALVIASLYLISVSFLEAISSNFLASGV